jgi:hypothetical protein
MTDIFSDTKDEPTFPVVRTDIFADVEDDTTTRIQGNLAVAKDLNPDMEAKSLRLSKGMGVPWNVVRGNEDKFEKAQSAPNVISMVTKSPKTAEYYKKFDAAAVSHDDSGPLMAVEKTWDYFKNLGEKASTSYKSGAQQISGSRLYAQRLENILTGQVDSPELGQQIAKYKAGRIKETPDENFVETGITAAAQMLPIILDTSQAALAEGGRWATIFGGTGLALGGPVLSIPLAKIGAVSGMKYGAAKEMFILEAGGALEEYEEMGLDPIPSALVSSAVGSINAALEFIGIKAYAKVLGVDKVISKIIREGGKKALQRPALRNALLGIAKKYGQSVAINTAQEGAQEAVTIIGGEVAKEFSSGDYPEMEFMTEALPRILESMKEGGAASATLGIPFSGIHSAVVVQQTQKQKAFETKFDAVRDAVESTKTKERSPEMTEVHLNMLGADQEVHLSPEGIQILFQESPEVAGDILERAGINPEQAQKAASEGNSVSTTLAKIHSYLTPEEQELIKPDLKPAPGAMTQRDVSNIDMKKELKRVDEQVTEYVEQQKTIQQTKAKLRTSIVDSGYSKQYADYSLELADSFANRMNLEGLDRVKFFEKMSIGQTVDADGIRYQQGEIDSSDENFKKFIAGSKAVTEKGDPAVVYSGHGNVGMFGEKFDPKKATAGAFYGTLDPELASSYSVGKFGNKEYREQGEQYRLKNPKTGKFNKKIWQIELSDEQKGKLDDILATGYEDEEGYSPEHSELVDMPSWIENNKGYDKEANRMSHTGGIHNLRNIFQWYDQMGYTIAYDTHEDGPSKPHFLKQNKNRFEELLEYLGIDWQSADWAVPGVFPGYVNVTNPLDTSQPFPPDLLEALKEASSRERTKSAAQISDTHWTKDYPLKEWVKDIEGWIAGEETFWATQVPTKAKKILQDFGYDGIKDTGGKGGGKEHTVFIWFESGQFKSKFNRGTFDPTDANILNQKVESKTLFQKIKERIKPSKLGFYSRVGKNIEEMDFTTIPAKDLVNRLKKTPGLKQEEFDDLGLYQWLDGEEGKVTKDQVLQFIQQGGPQIEEVVSGVKQTSGESIDQLTSLQEERDALVEAGRPVPEELNLQIEDLEGEVSDTKFDQYTLPGGENYREVKLTLPNRFKTVRELTKEEAGDEITGGRPVEVKIHGNFSKMQLLNMNLNS